MALVYVERGHVSMVDNLGELFRVFFLEVDVPVETNIDRASNNPQAEYQLHEEQVCVATADSHILECMR